MLRIQNSNDVTLEGFTAGHTREQGECSGGVLYLEGCTNTAMKDLGLYGCGVVGLTTHLCTDVTLSGSEIYECSSSAVNLHTSNNVSVSDCRVYDIGLEEYGGYTFFEMANSQNVTVSNCEFSISTLSNLMVSSGTQATFRNNLFVGNRIRGGALNINGQNVILDDNRFDGNSIRSWYDHIGNLASDAQGNSLTEAILNEMYPAEPIRPTQPQLEIHVKTVDELIAAIGPNKDIVLEGEFYDFSKATGYGTSSGDYYYWEDVHDGPGLVIRNVDNMTIRSNDGNVKNHTISAVPRYADVLAFSACSNVTLSGFTAGHTIEPGSCAGGVIEFRDCDNMLVDNCGLYGCGILGVYAEYSKNIYPDAIAAVNAGAFFDDGTASTTVGSYPLGLTIAGGKNISSPGEGLHPSLAGFVGFNSDNKLLVFDHNLTPEEAEELDIRDGVGIGPALIIDREIMPAADENSGYTARTAIGQKEDGTVILLCINGRVFNSAGATYEDVANEMMTYGADNAALLQGGSATAMMYRPNSTQEPQLLTSVSTLNGDKELQPRRLPTYWIIAAE